MKREYVKPVMESEEFVANEYVASCWDVTCHGSILNLFHEPHGKLPTVQGLTHDPTFDNNDRDKDGFGKWSIYGIEIPYYKDHYFVSSVPAERPNAS